MVWANDALANATVLSGTSGSITPLAYDGTTDPATSEPGETFYGAGETLWWKWTAPSSGNFEIDTLGSPDSAGSSNGLDTIMLLFSGPAASPTHAALTLIDSDDDAAVPVPYTLNSRITFTAVAGTTYYVQVDQYGTGQQGTLHLSWGLYYPAPTASTWTDTTAGRPAQTMYAGDDVIVAGTGLDGVTTVTIGGYPQAFTIDSSTQLTVHVGNNARDGTVVVSNSSGTSTATNGGYTFAHVRFPGPWTYPPDQDASDGPAPSFQATLYALASTAGPQPALDGALRYADSADFYLDSRDDGGSSAIWEIGGAIIVLDERTDAHMPDYVPPTSDPTVDFSEIYTADTPVPTSDLTITFDPTITGTPLYNEDSNGRSISEDLWQMHVEYRRLDPADWYFDPSTDRPKFTGDAWPSGLTGKTLDFDRLLRNPVDTLNITSAYPWTNNRAQMDFTTDYGFTGPILIPWSEFGTAMAWAVTVDALLDGPTITATVIDPVPGNRTGSQKYLRGTAKLHATWTYRPRRYRYIYTAPPAPAAAGWQVGSVAW